jgi:hypothetical protein
MLKTHRIAAILSFISLVSTPVLSSSHVLAQFQRIPPRLEGVEATISGKIYLSDLSSVNDLAKCENITVSLSKQVKNPNRSIDGLNLEYIQKDVASTTANGDIKRSYCDYTLKVLGLAGNYYLNAGAEYQTLTGRSDSGCRIDSTPVGWTNPITSFDQNRDVKLSRGCPPR